MDEPLVSPLPPVMLCSYYNALSFYLEEQPLLYTDLLTDLAPRIDHARRSMPAHHTNNLHARKISFGRYLQILHLHNSREDRAVRLPS